MEKFDKRTNEIVKRLQDARLSLLSKQPFYAILLLHMRFALDTSCETSYTDGERIAFNIDFIEALSDKELEFVLMHEVLHAALGHPFRKQSDFDLECYDLACDIVVNSNILYSFNNDISSITIKNYGIAIHKTPSGKEGYECTVEEVYEELLKNSSKKPPKKKGKGSKKNNDGTSKKGDKSSNEESESDEQNENEDKENDKETDSEEAIDEIDSKNSEGNAKNAKNGKSKKSNVSRNNSECADGEKWEDTNEYDLEALISQLKAKNNELSQKYASELLETKKSSIDDMETTLDDHSFWDGDDECHTKRTTWENNVMQCTELVLEKEDSHKGFGGPPLCAQRLVKELTNPEVDWRTVLNDFIQEEINDYSFSPPDKRMDDCPFFLPDFNEKDEKVKNVWFLIDTSGSIGDKEIEAAYSEIISAIDMFNGKLEGLLSFTEVFVTEPIPFCDAEELLNIKPVGGGGNDFGEIFRYMQRNMMDDLPTSIVIMTDGYDTYPPESESLGVPVFWLINNNDAEPPPWGRWARFKVNK